MFMPVYVFVDISSFMLFFFNDTATTEIYTLSLHDALPICKPLFFEIHRLSEFSARCLDVDVVLDLMIQDRKSTRLNSSHSQISYAVFCLKKKNTQWPGQCQCKHRRCMQRESTTAPRSWNPA